MTNFKEKIKEAIYAIYPYCVAEVEEKTICYDIGVRTYIRGKEKRDWQRIAIEDAASIRGEEIAKKCAENIVWNLLCHEEEQW